MARRKLSPKDWAALNRGRPVTNYPQGGGRAELRILGKRQKQQKEGKEPTPSRACPRGGGQ